MFHIRKIITKAKQFFISNLIEVLISIGASFVFAGLHMIYSPLSYLAVGVIILFFAYAAYKNQ